MKNKKITIIYDLSISPITFDAAVYFCAVFSVAIKQQFTHFEIVIRADRLRLKTPRDINTPLEEKYWRLWNILIPLTRLLPGVIGVNVAFNEQINLQEGDIIMPKGYANRLPEIAYTPGVLVKLNKSGHDIQILRPNQYALRVAEGLTLNHPKTVIIPLRNARFDSSRDSSYDTWYQVYKYLLLNGYMPIVIPDQGDVLHRREFAKYDWFVCEYAAIDLDLRLALYAKSVTVGWSGGHSTLLYLSKSKCILFGLLNNSSKVSSCDYWSKNFIPVDSEPNFLTEQQRWDWLEASQVTPEHIISRVNEYFTSIGY